MRRRSSAMYEPSRLPFIRAASTICPTSNARQTTCSSNCGPRERNRRTDRRGGRQAVPQPDCAVRPTRWAADRDRRALRLLRRYARCRRQRQRRRRPARAGAPAGAKPPKHAVELVAYTLEEPPYFRTDSMGSVWHARELRRTNREVRLMLSLEMIGFYRDAPNSQAYPVARSSCCIRIGEISSASSRHWATSARRAA